jgi:hypothetical protein
VTDVPQLKETIRLELQEHRSALAICDRAEPASADRRPAGRRSVPVLAGLVLGLTAVGVSAQVIDHGSELDTSALVDPAAAAEAIDRLGAGIPLPPGGSFRPLEADLAPAWQDERGFRGMLEFNASCQWYASWLHAHRDGDRAAADRALDTMRAMPSWSDYHEEMPETVRRLDAAATAGDEATVQRFLDINCDETSGRNLEGDTAIAR